MIKPIERGSFGARQFAVGVRRGLIIAGALVVTNAVIAPQVSAQTLSAHRSTSTIASRQPTAAPSAASPICFRQKATGKTAPVMSTEFDDPEDQPFTSEGMQPFKTKKSCTIDEIDAQGTWLGNVPADPEFHIIVSGFKKGVPTKVFNDFTVTCTTGTKGTVVCPIPVEQKVCCPDVSCDPWSNDCAWMLSHGGHATPDTRQMGVPDYGPSSGWLWSTTDKAKIPAVWQNPNDGYGTGCTTWTSLVRCLGAQGEGTGFAFTLRGSPIK